jgi:exonuclease III
VTKVVVWNCFRRRPGSPEQVALRDRVTAESPDVVFLTETDTGMLPMHEISSEPHWNSRRATERMVALYSRNSWAGSQSDHMGTGTAGRVAAGTTAVAGLPVFCIGVCVPYSGARWRKDEPLPRWQAHLAFLKGLGTAISRLDSALPVILAGDFNQAVPRSRAPRGVFEALGAAAGRHMTCVTEGLRDDDGQPVIDHIFVSRHFLADSVRCLPKTGSDGRDLSDHVGIAVDIGLHKK